MNGYKAIVPNNMHHSLYNMHHSLYSMPIAMVYQIQLIADIPYLN